MPFSFLNQDALQALYGESPDGVFVERFDAPYNDAELQSATPSIELKGIANIVYANPTFLKLLRNAGLDVDPTATGKLFSAVENTFDDSFIALWRTRPTAHIDNLQIAAHMDSSQRQTLPFMLSTTPIKHNGQVYGCCTRVTDATGAITRDSDERRALQQIEAFVRTENVPLICLQFAQPVPNPVTVGQLGTAYLQSTITHVTNSAAQLFGSQPIELRGTTLADTANPQIINLLANAFPASNTKEPLNLTGTPELLVDMGGPEQLVYRVKPTFVFEQSKAVEAWLRIEDKTSKQRRIRHQQTLEQTRNLALEAAALYQFEVNLETQVVTIDKAGFDSMGLSHLPNDVAGWTELLQPERLNISIEELHRQFSGEATSVNFIALLQNTDGDDRYLEIWGRFNSQTESGVVARRTLGLYRDVTDSEKLNARLSEKKTLESLGVLAGGVAHDFNNLLMSVLGYAELMEADILDSPQRDRSPLLQTSLHNLSEIRAAALRASELCTSLLAYAGQHLIEKKSIDLTELVRTTAELVEVTIGKRVPLLLDLDNEVMIAADQGQLTQVIINLVGNAADAMENSAGAIQIGIHTTVLKPEEQALLDGQISEPGERLACLTVRDSGYGMSSDTLQRMYEPFYTTKTEGRGLGMAAVHGIVKNHGGGILVDSTEGEGTEFRVCFPLLARIPTSEHSISVIPVNTVKNSPNVLVVDDEAGVRRIAAEMLRHLSCTVQEADSAETALALFADHTFDYALIDITMPVMSGCELAEILLEQVPGLNIVLCSGYTEKDVPEALLERCTFIHKPYTLGEVSNALNLE